MGTFASRRKGSWLGQQRASSSGGVEQQAAAPDSRSPFQPALSDTLPHSPPPPHTHTHTRARARRSAHSAILSLLLCILFFLASTALLAATKGGCMANGGKLVSDSAVPAAINRRRALLTAHPGALQALHVQHPAHRRALRQSPLDPLNSILGALGSAIGMQQQGSAPPPRAPAGPRQPVPVAPAAAPAPQSLAAATPAGQAVMQDMAPPPPAPGAPPPPPADGSAPPPPDYQSSGSPPPPPPPPPPESKSTGREPGTDAPPDAPAAAPAATAEAEAASSVTLTADLQAFLEQAYKEDTHPREGSVYTQAQIDDWVEGVATAATAGGKSPEFATRLRRYLHRQYEPYILPTDAELSAYMNRTFPDRVVRPDPRKRFPPAAIDDWVEGIVREAGILGKGPRFQARLAEFLHAAYDPLAAAPRGPDSACMAVDLGIAAGEMGLFVFGGVLQGVVAGCCSRVLQQGVAAGCCSEHPRNLHIPTNNNLQPPPPPKNNPPQTKRHDRLGALCRQRRPLRRRRPRRRGRRGRRGLRQQRLGPSRDPPGRLETHGAGALWRWVSLSIHTP
jgi:hypothetical protein